MDKKEDESRSTMTVSSLTKRGHKKESNGDLDILITEKEPLIAKSDKTGDLDYSKSRSLEIHTTWRHWLIGPVIFIYIFAMICSYFTLVTYTKEYFRKVKYEKANISLDNNHSTTDEQCDTDADDIVYQTETKATATAATWALYYSLATGIPAVISNMVLGSYTDTFGRKFLIAVGIICTCLRLGISAVVINFDADITYILIACFVEGCTGQYATALQASFAYVADITKPGRSRMLGIVYVEFFLGIGMASATMTAGYLIRWQGYMFIFSSMAVVLVVALVLMLLALPETHTNEHQHRHKSCVAILKISMALFTVNDSENRRWKYQLVLLMHMLVNITFHARLSTETLYQLASPFCWSITKIGIYAAIRTIVVMFIGLGSIKVFQLFLDEIWICMIGTVSYCAAFLWTAFVKDDVTFYISKFMYYSILRVACFRMSPLSTFGMYHLFIPVM